MDSPIVISILSGVMGFLLGVITIQLTVMKRFERLSTGIAVNGESIENLRNNQKDNKDLFKETLGVVKELVAQNTVLIKRAIG